jgi:hypothetical protein
MSLRRQKVQNQDTLTSAPKTNDHVVINTIRDKAKNHNSCNRIKAFFVRVISLS